MTYEILTNRNVRKTNCRYIYKYLYSLRGARASNQEIARTLKLSLPTVNSCVEELKEQALLVDSGLQKSTGGRRSQTTALNPTAHYSIGINILQSHIELVLIDMLGNVLEENDLKLSFADEDPYYARIWEFIQSVLAAHSIPTDTILGVAISAPALVPADNASSPYLALLGRQDWGIKRFTRYIPFPCRLYNDSNAGCFAEIWQHIMFHPTDSNKNMVFLSINDSVGGAFFSKDELYTGDHSFAGEFGHMTLVPRGLPCYCGQKGCVNAYLSLKNLTNQAEGSLSLFFDKLQTRDSNLSILWEEYKEHLAVAVNNLHMVFDCEIVIGGRIAQYLDSYLTDLQCLLQKKNILSHVCNYLTISHQKDYSAALGAALMLIDQFIKTL